MGISLNELPDFNDIMGIANEIGSLKTSLMQSKASLDVLLAMISGTVTTEEKYLLGGKRPSMSYIKSYYHILGTTDGERTALASLRSDIASFEGQLKTAEAIFIVMREQINIWRTESANKRSAIDVVGDLTI